ncbi:M20/M25/M40 family metallo-hydrolase, partial [Chloroflexota bacterium]
MSVELKNIYNYIDEHIDEHVARIQEWIRQPSISNTGEGIVECAELTRTYFQQLGCHRTEIIEPGVTKWGSKGNPVVYGEYNAGAEKTLIIYFMYDTMPVEELADWRSPPFEAGIVEQHPFKKVIIGRGAVNSKGPGMAILNALQSIKAVAGNLPVNLKLIAEGDEERMSTGLHKFVYDHKDTLSKADAFMGWGYQGATGLARVVSGSEGCLYFELETSGTRWGRGPTGSSIHGGHKRYVDSPAWRHIKMLSTLVSNDGNEILVKGWYDDIEQPSPEDDKLLDEAIKYYSPELAGEVLQVSNFINNLTGKDLLMRELYGTSLNLDGIWGGLTHPGTAGSIIPNKVTSKHNCRYVPNQHGDDLLRKIRVHLDENGYKDVEIRVIGDGSWLKANYDTDIAKAMLRMYKNFGVECRILPGTGVSILAGPYWPGHLFGRDPLHLPVIMGGLGHGGRAHASNEYFV